MRSAVASEAPPWPHHESRTSAAAVAGFTAAAAVAGFAAGVASGGAGLVAAAAVSGFEAGVVADTAGSAAAASATAATACRAMMASHELIKNPILSS
jgi:hypothetical protein